MPTPSTIPQVFFSQAAQYAERCMLKAKREGAYRDMRWSEVQQAVEELAIALLGEGVAPGDRVALLAENRPEWLLSDLAIQAIQAVTVPIYPTEMAAKSAFILRNCGASVAIVSTQAQLEKILEQRSQLPSLRQVVVCDPLDITMPAGACALVDYLERGALQRDAQLDEVFRRMHAALPQDLATIIYTSGTTGDPKGVMLTHHNFLTNVHASGAALRITDTDVHLSFLPLSHVFERMAGFYLMVYHGATISYAESMDTVGENLREVRPTLLLGVPRFYEKLHARVLEGVTQAPPLRQRIFHWAMRIGHRRLTYRARGTVVPIHLRVLYRIADRLVYRTLRRRLGGRLRFCVSGAAPLPTPIAKFFAAAGLQILEGYGLTETSPVISFNTEQHTRIGSVGRVIEGVQVRIADDGEILTRGPHVMQGYYANPDATRAVMSDDWFHTGDIGRLDADDFLYITDRKKDLIKTAGGKMVAPQKLEQLLIRDTYIQQAFVFGDKERYIVALLVPVYEQLASYAEAQQIPYASRTELLAHPRIMHMMRERVDANSHDLATYEQIKYFALLAQECTLESGELTPTMKVRRAVLQEKYASILEQLYAAPQPTPAH